MYYITVLYLQNGLNRVLTVFPKPNSQCSQGFWCKFQGFLKVLKQNFWYFSNGDPIQSYSVHVCLNDPVNTKHWLVYPLPYSTFICQSNLFASRQHMPMHICVCWQPPAMILMGNINGRCPQIRLLPVIFWAMVTTILGFVEDVDSVTQSDCVAQLPITEN